MAAPSGGIVQKLTGNPVGEAAAFAGGLAIHPVLRPILQELTNLTWSEFRSLPVDAVRAAEGVAHGHIDLATGEKEASLTGVSTDRFAKLVEFSRVGPGIASAFELWRRDKIDDAGFELALTRAGLEATWITALKEIKLRVLDPSVIALGIVRSILKDPGLMPVQLDTSGGVVPAYRQSSIDPVAEALANGVPLEHLRVLVGEIGLPMSTHEAASAFFRKIIERGDYYRSILEGDVRPEWADAILEQAREILTAHDYAELELRGYFDRTKRLELTAQHGMSEQDSDYLYEVLGRAPGAHAVTVGLARGGKYPGTYANVPEPYKSAIRRSNIREEFAELVYAARYTYPSGFQIKAEVKAHDLTAAEGEAILLEIGWSPKWAKFFPEKWYGQGATTTTSPQKSATGRAVTSIGKAYIAGNTSRAQAETELTTLGEDPATYPGLFVAWDVNRAATLQALTNTQIRNRFRNLGMSETEALAILEGRGIPAAEALAYLTAPVRPPAT